jgi:hypothetical protein
MAPYLEPVGLILARLISAYFLSHKNIIESLWKNIIESTSRTLFFVLAEHTLGRGIATPTLWVFIFSLQLQQ